MGSGDMIVADAADKLSAVVGSTIFAGFAGIWICAVVIGGLISLFFLVIWIIALIDCARRKPEEFPGDGENAKTIWLVILIATFFVTQMNGIAAIVYYFMVMKKCPRINNNVKMP